MQLKGTNKVKYLYTAKKLYNIFSFFKHIPSFSRSFAACQYTIVFWNGNGIQRSVPCSVGGIQPIFMTFLMLYWSYKAFLDLTFATRGIFGVQGIGCLFALPVKKHCPACLSQSIPSFPFSWLSPLCWSKRPAIITGIGVFFKLLPLHCSLNLLDIKYRTFGVV